MKRKLMVVVASLVVGGALHGSVAASDSADEIRARLKPFGDVCRVGQDCGGLEGGAGGAMSAPTVAAVGAATGLSGQQIYDRFCFACHNTGVGEAPLFGSLEQWQSRIDQGMQQMLAVSLTGRGLMPPKGTCVTCSDDEMQAAIQYMVDSAQ
ncbi:MAG: cytochrome c5 family protein [Gammaproteobacteria bacterium]|nr:cytochrome c5 family protein [Gammaproteobacteria bacterium]MYG14724.1 cytochrome c5 family protein [Gammaproteobacteria bacterium]